MKKLRVILKLLPIVGDFYQSYKDETKRDLDWWLNSALDLGRTVITALAAAGIIKGDIPIF